MTAVATTQIAGRGRGSNVWIAPPGTLIFSTVIKHPISLTQSSPVVFVQYLAALATVLGVKGYEPGYAALPVKIKWPNDVYALDPAANTKVHSSERTKYVKIGGILVNSSYSGGDYNLVAGVGMNVANVSPTTSLDAMAKAHGLPPFQMEKLLASILTCFERIYNEFCREGWSKNLESQYYKEWLHKYDLYNH